MLGLVASDTLNDNDEVGDATAATTAYEVVKIPGKGTGLVAQQKFYPGDVIMFEKPLIVVSDNIYDDPEQVDKFLDKAVTRLSSQDRELFLNLTDCNSPEDPSYLGIFDTNDMDFMGDAAVFPEMARANHSCQPNSQFITDNVNRIQKLIAIDIIDTGEEITINYLPMEEEGSDIKEQRQKYLRKWYNFTCTCTNCSRQKDETQEDDAVREDIKELQAGGLDNLTPEELDILVVKLFSIYSKHDYILRALDVLYRKQHTRAVPDNVYRLYVAVQGLCLASGLYGWSDVQTVKWRDRTSLGIM